MDDRGTGLIILLGASLLCGLPGLVSLCCAATLVLAGISSESSYASDLTPGMATGLGIAGLCVGLLFVLIPIAVGFFTFRRKPKPPVVNWDEPIPPPI